MVYVHTYGKTTIWSCEWLFICWFSFEHVLHVLFEHVLHVLFVEFETNNVENWHLETVRIFFVLVFFL